MYITAQPILHDADTIKHPVWDHRHVVWWPLYVTGGECMTLDQQEELYLGIAMRASEAACMTHWNKPWVLSLPAEVDTDASEE